jgi:hypothetical protein
MSQPIMRRTEGQREEPESVCGESSSRNSNRIGEFSADGSHRTHRHSRPAKQSRDFALRFHCDGVSDATRGVDPRPSAARRVYEIRGQTDDFVWDGTFELFCEYAWEI